MVYSTIPLCTFHNRSDYSNIYSNTWETGTRSNGIRSKSEFFNDTCNSVLEGLAFFVFYSFALLNCYNVFCNFSRNFPELYNICKYKIFVQYSVKHNSIKRHTEPRFMPFNSLKDRWKIVYAT